MAAARIPEADDRARFLERAPALGLSDWWLTAGALLQTVWNRLDGPDPAAGIRDDDPFDDDVSCAAEDRVVQAAAHLVSDVDAVVEACHEARVHHWSEERFGGPAVAFTTRCVAVTTLAGPGTCLRLPQTEGQPRPWTTTGPARLGMAVEHGDAGGSPPVGRGRGRGVAVGGP